MEGDDPAERVAGDIEVLQGGVANAGSVFRIGDEVSRPSNANSPTIHRFLAHVRTRGLMIAPEPRAIDDDGRERLEFIPGDVPIPPYPEWAQSDDALLSIVRLMRSMHEASRDFVALPRDSWSPEMADFGGGGAVICHNDVCLENVVFCDGLAIALLDFDFAAPGRASYELACFARMCVPRAACLGCERYGFADSVWHHTLLGSE